LTPLGASVLLGKGRDLAPKKLQIRPEATMSATEKPLNLILEAKP
jgi:hypothetical protein